MRVVFAGTPDFARHALECIVQAGYDVPLVLTQPDRRSGRGMRVTPSAVKQCAMDADIPVCQPRSLRLDGNYADDARTARQALQAAQPDVMVVAAYGLLLPDWVLSLPRYGCLNIHASLLPRWRGAAPIQRAIAAGDSETGITIMQMDAGLDTGDMLFIKREPIHDTDTAATLHDRLALTGGQAILEALAQLQAGTLQPTPQPEQGVTYAHKLSRDEAALDLRLGATELARLIRAFNPFPGATLQLPGLEQAVKVWQACSIETNHKATPGEVLSRSDDGIDVATGDGVLRILTLQRPGGKRQPAAAFIQGWSG